MLVIHPKDPSTDFLKVLYESRTDVRLIDDIGSVKELRHALNHVALGETVMLLGHGCPNGLYALDGNGYKLINLHGLSFYLRKHFVVGVFCYANQFAEKERLTGLFTGMIVSELFEAEDLNIKTSQKELDGENPKFARNFRKLLDEQCPISEFPSRMKALDSKHSSLTDYNYGSIYTVGYNR